MKVDEYISLIDSLLAYCLMLCNRAEKEIDLGRVSVAMSCFGINGFLICGYVGINDLKTQESTLEL